MWSWKNDILYSWAKRYPNEWTLVNVKVDDRKKHIRLQITEKILIQDMVQEQNHH